MNGSIKSIGFIIVIIFMAAIFWKQHQERKASISWPSTTGIILTSYVKQVIEKRKNNGGNESLNTHYEIAVEYTYTVDSIQYEGHRISVNAQSYSSEKSASNDLSNYLIGSRVAVYYDPSKPKKVC